MRLPVPSRITGARLALGLLVTLLSFVASSVLAAPAHAGTVEDENRLYELHNQARSQNGLAPLAYDPAAVGVARGWAAELARTGSLRHNPDLAGQVQAYVTSEWTRLGENVGFASSPDQVFTAYMNSAPHRANILGDFNRVGVGAARDASGRLWTTVVFIKGPALTAAAPSPYPFTDISTSVHRDNIVTATGLGLMRGGPAGLTATQFGPALNITRGQLATLVRNLLAGAGITADSPGNAFADDNGDVHELSINVLAALGVVGGNGESGSSYFPARPATRSEIASFLGRAYELATRQQLPTGPDAFTDDEGNPAEDEINGLAALGVVSGKAPGIFDPGASVNRAQVATMVVQLLGATA